MKDKKNIKSEPDTAEETKVVENTESDLIQKIKDLEQELAKTAEERLCDLADFENIKKRLEKEKEQAIAYAHEKFAKDMLSITDTLESALSNIKGAKNKGKKQIKEIKKGLKLTLNQIQTVFSKHGVERISDEKKFDLNIHNAVTEVESDKHPPGSIVSVFQRGYKIKERILRPTMVSVAKKTNKEEK